MGKASKPRKSRVSFTLKKDIHLLRAALQFNTWQLGSEEWARVTESMGSIFGQSFTNKGVEKRVNLLVEKYKKEELKVSTGTEEEVSERGDLLKDIIAIQEEENAAINAELNADTVDMDDVTINDNLDVQILNVENPELGDEVEVENSSPTRCISVAKQRKLNRAAADKERDAYLDQATGPNVGRSGRSRLTLEEEMISQKQNQDFEIDKRRLDIEEMREKRLNEESERRDELAKGQLEIQASMIQMMAKFLEK